MRSGASRDDDQGGAMSMLRNLIVGIDFSDQGSGALAQGLRIAREAKTRLTVLHVIDQAVVRELQSAYNLTAEAIIADARKDAVGKIEGLIEGVGGRPDECEIVIPVGDPFNEIVSRVGEGRKADLLIMGSTGASDPGGDLGALASKCVRHATCRVMLVRRNHTGPYRHIVVGVDFSATSSKAMREAIEFARHDQASLDVIHAFAPPWDRLHYRSATPEAAPEFRAQYRATLEGRLRGLVEGCCTDREKPAIRCKLIECVHPSDAILDHIRESRADLAIVGTRGQSPIRHWFFGTTAERVVSNAPCSVVVIKPGDEAEAAESAGAE